MIQIILLTGLKPQRALLIVYGTEVLIKIFTPTNWSNCNDRTGIPDARDYIRYPQVLPSMLPFQQLFRESQLAW